MMLYLHFPGGFSVTAVLKSGLEILARAKWLSGGRGFLLWLVIVAFVCLYIRGGALSPPLRWVPSL